VSLGLVVQCLLDHMTLGHHHATKRGELPIHLGAQGGHASVVGALLEGKSDVDAENILGQTPLELAAAEGHPQVARILLRVRREEGDLLRLCLELPPPSQPALLIFTHSPPCPSLLGGCGGGGSTYNGPSRGCLAGEGWCNP
jgi:hypothetical protein